MPVDTRLAAYEANLSKWEKIADCLGGRDAVIAQGAKYLPKLQGNPQGYEAYKDRANFYAASKRTVIGLSGGVNQKPPVVEFPKEHEEVLENVSPRGKVSIQEFAHRLTTEVLSIGRAGVLVDMPKEPNEDGTTTPFITMYRAVDITSWRTKRAGSREVLDLVILYECVELPDPEDPFKLDEVEQYRVLMIVDGFYSNSVWRKKENSKDWVRTEETFPVRRGVKLTFIPFVFVGPTGVSPDIEASPIEDLVDVNLAHYRNSADLEQALHMVAMPTPYVSGLKTSPANDEPVPIGPGVVWELTEGGSAGMVEGSFSGLSALQAEMEEKKKQMASLGARLVDTQASVQETAEAVRIRHSGEHASLTTIAASVSMAMTNVVQWLDWWLSLFATPEESKSSVEMNKEFLSVKASSEEVKTLFLGWQSGAMSFETMYHGLTKGGWSREGVTSKEEKAEIEREMPDPVDDPNADPNEDPNAPPNKNTPPDPKKEKEEPAKEEE